MMTCEDVNICEEAAPFLLLNPEMELIECDSLFCVPASALDVPVNTEFINTTTNFNPTNHPTTHHCKVQPPRWVFFLTKINYLYGFTCFIDLIKYFQTSARLP